LPCDFERFTVGRLCYLLPELSNSVSPPAEPGVYLIKLMHMRSTLNIDDELLRRVAEPTGEKEKTLLARMGLKVLIARESARRLVKLDGSELKLQAIRRRRMGRA